MIAKRWRGLAAAVLVLPWNAMAAAEPPVAGPAKNNVEIKKSPSGGDEIYKEVAMFIAVMRLLNRDYVDADRVTYHRLINGALSGMLSSLDKYSSFMPPQNFRDLSEDTGGKYVGIGISFSWKGKNPRVESVVPDSPAAKAGLQAGDEIIAINDSKLSDLKPGEGAELFRGDSGSKIKIVYMRNGNKNPIEADVVRDEIVSAPVPSDGCGFAADGIGYIRVKIFSEPLPLFLDNALVRLKRANLDGVVIDLRDNPGGKLEAAVAMCSRFIPSGKKVVSTVGRTAVDNKVFLSEDCEKELTLPLVILVNRRSASAAEIVAGCLKDYRRAVLVGENTYGKASVQRLQELPEHYGGIRFTVAYYHTPNDIRIGDQGVMPDIKVDIPADKRAALQMQLRRYPGVIHPSGMEIDPQLQRAVELLKSSQVFSDNKTQLPKSGK